MRKFENIIASDTEPDTNSIWLKDGSFYYFNNGTWREIIPTTSPVQEDISTNTEEE